MRPGSALLLTPTMPAAAGNGLAMRAGLLLEGLARAFDVDVLVVPVFGGAIESDGFVRAHARRICTLELDHHTDPVAELTSRLQTPEGRARAQAVHPLPALSRAATMAAAAAVAQCADSHALVVAMRMYLCPFLDLVLDRLERPPIVIDVDDIESATQRALGNEAEAERYARTESHYLPLVELVTTCSREDAGELAGRLGLDAVTPIPNAVRLAPDASASPVGLSGGFPPTVLFVGNLSYEPNVDGARWLCRSVLPLLGDVRVALVGSRPTEAVRALASDPRVTVVADVDSVSEWYAAASIAVVPVRRGGGSRIKLIEAFAHHRPVVATTLGAHGMPWPESHTPVLLADSAAQFAAACRALLNDPPLARRRAQAGHELVARYATVDVVVPRIAEIMRSVSHPAATPAR
jgi:glycosyltransferase involved in cell wall biosynthesis